jgi:MoaA/NifB/PqqE/SkfB family radical SAM enzyme
MRMGFLGNATELARFLIRGIPRGAVGSIDATERCNLRCRHCYFFSPAYERAGDDDLERWRARFEAMRGAGEPLWGVTWVGGEPLLRPELILLGMRYFRFNKVVTNGTFPLPDWPRVSFVVSVDGTEAAHDRQRGARTYAKIRENVRRAPAGLNVVLHCCLTALNVDSIEDLLEEWRHEPIRGIVFDFYTPVAGLDDALWMGWERRDRAIARLLAAKRRHGDFLRVPRGVLRAMRRQTMRRYVGSPEVCALARKSFALGTRGERKRPCVLGEKADCGRCGCIVPYAMGRIERRDPEVIRFLFGGGF